MSIRDHADGVGTPWATAGRSILEKAISELAYEGGIAPHVVEPGVFALDLGDVTYRFEAGHGALGNLQIVADSVIRSHGTTDMPADDPGQLLIDLQPLLGMTDATLCEALREMFSTRLAESRILAAMPTGAQLADLSYGELERHLTGHPTMILNKGRVGFSARDLARYAPESGAVLQLPWIAVHRDLACFSSIGSIAQRDFLASELDVRDIERFRNELLESIGPDQEDDFIWLPVHTWQWEEILTTHFAPQLADGRMVLLGSATDRLLPSQSIRTLSNVDRPDRRDVKVALSIRNTMVYRGIASGPTTQAPAISAWLQAIHDRDQFLTGECGMELLGEVASAAVTHPVYQHIEGAPYRLAELLGAVWRDPIETRLGPGERARSMAALLSVGSDKRSMIAEHVSRSGLDPQNWLGALLHALLPGLLHYLYAYGVAFAPHGQNIVIIYDRSDIPVRVAVKDFAEDVNLLVEDLPEYGDLPSDAEAVLHRWGPDELSQSIQTCVFSGQFRYLARIVETELGLPEPAFWGMVGREILDYQSRFPALKERFHLFDLFRPGFGKTTLNLEQFDMLSDPDRSERDPGFDLIQGTAPNPLHHNASGTETDRIDS
ncbi:IucA/IucC family protein [Tsukamurella ocularis]|uniref:IucA/IucC family protein n=1 Tax=Tsukamurella ocularis TaxID=1970234 RepID=UPI0021675296|nr:IucA/IucC family protein [Tsukamurella ocularis]MCS3780425.1 siderophore synthetase component [Tsukamurella ocularis]MCS3786020.1 siderophore synthetase component [Tsukamurella ocularis]MCS3849384.1 siderophore synthetase component [Tsukamurella ocularis]